MALIRIAVAVPGVSRRFSALGMPGLDAHLPLSATVAKNPVLVSHEASSSGRVRRKFSARFSMSESLCS